MHQKTLLLVLHMPKKESAHTPTYCVDRTYTRFIRLKKVMTIAMATPSALLQLSVHMFAQHSVAKSSGRSTAVAMITGSLMTKRCMIDLPRVRVGVRARLRGESEG